MTPRLWCTSTALMFTSLAALCFVLAPTHPFCWWLGDESLGGAILILAEWYRITSE